MDERFNALLILISEQLNISSYILLLLLKKSSNKNNLDDMTDLSFCMTSIEEERKMLEHIIKAGGD